MIEIFNERHDRLFEGFSTMITNKVVHDLTWNRYLVEIFDLGPRWNSWIFSKTSTKGELRISGGSTPRHASGPKVGLPNTGKPDVRGAYNLHLTQYEAWAVSTALKEGIIRSKDEEIPKQYMCSLLGNYERRFDESSAIRFSDLVDKINDGSIHNLDDFDALLPQYGPDIVVNSINNIIASRLTFVNATGMLSDSMNRSWPSLAYRKARGGNKPWTPLTDAFQVLNLAFGEQLLDTCQKLNFVRFHQAQQTPKADVATAPASSQPEEPSQKAKSRRRPS